MFKFSKKPILIPVCFVLLCATTACRQLAESLTKEVEIDLPIYPNSLVVESYLIPGQVYALLLSETISTETGLNLSFVNNAQVVITHGTEIDTLKPLTLTINNQPLTAYFALKTVPADYANVFRLEVKTKDGRTCSASTQILPPVALDSTVIQYNTAGDKASLLAGFKDNAATRDFYRYTVAEVINGRDSIRSAQRRSDQALNGQSLFFSTAFRFEKKDTLKANLYHITPDYFRFLESVSAAQGANGNPFASPASLVSNITGGIGIFTGTSVTTKQVILR